jgi:glutamine synthetase adenylyltransferase
LNQDETPEMVKIGFKLERDGEDYPPADWEWLWATRVSGSTFRLDNVPFFAKLISSGDIVAAEKTAQGFIFRGLVQPSGHSTVRIVFYRENETEEQFRVLVEDVTKSLRAMGCSTELSHLPNLVAVDIPPTVNYDSVAEFLSEKESAGLLGYEEACLASG